MSKNQMLRKKNINEQIFLIHIHQNETRPPLPSSPPPKKNSAAVGLELGSFGLLIQCATTETIWPGFWKGSFSLVLWENISVSYLPLNCLPLKRFVYVLLINARYASFDTLENEKCKTPAYIYSSKNFCYIVVSVEK